MKLIVKKIIFIGLILVGAIITLMRPGGIHFQTDLTSLIKMDSNDDWPIADITNQFSNVMNVVIQTTERINGEIIATHVRDIVDEFDSMEIMTASVAPREFVSSLGQYKNFFISTQYRELMKQNDFASITKLAVNRVESSVAPNMLSLQDDPFLLVSNYITELNSGGNGWIPQDGILWQYRSPNNFYMIPIKINIDDNDMLADTVIKFQSRVYNLQNDKTQIYIGGTPVHTAQMYNASKTEIGILSAIALIMIIVLNYILFRKIRTIIPIGISLCVGYLTGIIALFLCFGTPHILVFVFGTTLVGLGIDYSLHTICAGPDNKTTNKNILHSLITTIICFAPLMFSSVELLRQISVFTIIGLIAIYLFIRLFVNTHAKCMINFAPKPVRKKFRTPIIATIFVVIIAAIFTAKTENNMSAIYRPNAELAAAERVIGELNGTKDSGFLIVRGETLQEILETQEKLRDDGTDFFGISNVIPSLKRQNENQEYVQKLYASQAKKIRTALALKNTPQFKACDALTLENAGAIGDVMKKFLIESNGFIYSVSTITGAPTINDTNARVVQPAKTIEQTMTQYTMNAYRLLTICGVALMIALFAMYRRHALRYIGPAIMGAGAAVAIITILGMPLTFFHFLALFIVVGLGLDYAIFHINTNSANELRATFYSFLTSFIGFGLLAFTSFFVIAAMGITLAIGIAVAYLTSLYLFRGGTDKVR